MPKCFWVLLCRSHPLFALHGGSLSTSKKSLTSPMAALAQSVERKALNLVVARPLTLWSRVRAPRAVLLSPEIILLGMVHQMMRRRGIEPGSQPSTPPALYSLQGFFFGPTPWVWLGGTRRAPNHHNATLWPAQQVGKEAGRGPFGARGSPPTQNALCDALRAASGVWG